MTNFALNESVPLLVSLFRNRDEIPNRPQILTLLCLIIAAMESNPKIVAEDSEVQKALLSYKDDVLGLFVAGIQSDDSREAAIEGLRKLVALREVITEEEMIYIVHTITEVLLSSAENPEASRYITSYSQSSLARH